MDKKNTECKIKSLQYIILKMIKYWQIFTMFVSLLQQFLKIYCLYNECTYFSLLTILRILCVQKCPVSPGTDLGRWLQLQMSM